MSRLFQVRRFPTWIRKALNLTDTEVPASLFAQRDKTGPFAPIVNIVDTFQGGVAVGDPIVIAGVTATVTAGPVAQVIDLSTGNIIPVVAGAVLNADPNFGYIVFALEISCGIAATRTPVFFMAPTQAFVNDLGVRISQQPSVIPSTTGAVSWVEIMRGGAPFFVPPGFLPAVWSNDLIAGETLTVFASLMRIPAGFKPY